MSFSNFAYTGVLARQPSTFGVQRRRGAYPKLPLLPRAALRSFPSLHPPWRPVTPPRARARAYVPAFAMGFGTSSSAATMPMTMECASKYGCRESLVRFVIPLGTNINRDGAALYEATSVIFIAQARCALGAWMQGAGSAPAAAMQSHCMLCMRRVRHHGQSP